MASKKSDDLKNIIIVGGGAVGTTLARTLSAKINASTHHIVLVDPRPFQVVLPVSLRFLTSDRDNLQETTLPSYDKLFVDGTGTFVEGKVATIQKGDRKGGSVTLENGEIIAFEYLVLATGSIFQGPLAFPETKDDVLPFVEGVRKRIKDANDIVLAGGGSVAIELAGEIKDIYPNKNVTVVQGGGHLLNDVYPLRFRTFAEQGLVKRDIKLVLNDYLDDIPTDGFTSVKTRSGTTIKADVVFNTRGGRPNTEFIKSLGPDVLTPGGLVKVRPTLQLAAYDDIFAGGDILDVKEQKQYAKALTHASVLAANILASISSTNSKLKPYKCSAELIVITIGKGCGVAYLGILWGIVLGDWFVRLVKP
ncbi:hypothetical protein CCMSSC00406_0007408 [Pleurotus cornucopiae]|uniref:Uncharacterized protein n=1 Tax=Pleurotus cornucopiae TaxID=5321 RepID=A0ACB7J5E2_PLECO|nr:hypothetical protein CCMSSC00406_0007408 [Pleurotus cornucopiae]